MPTDKKRIEILSTMKVYTETVNRFINKYKGYNYLDQLNYKHLYNPADKDLRIASNYSTNALAFAITRLNARLDLIKKNCKARIYKHIKDKKEQHYLFYILKKPLFIKALMQQQPFILDKQFDVYRPEYLNKYLHRILRHEFKNNNVPELKKQILRTDVVTAKIESYKDFKKFSHVIRLSTINKGSRVVIPFNPNKYVEQYLDKRKGCYTIFLDEHNNPQLHIPIEVKVAVNNNNTQELGIDKGFRTLLVDSNHNFYGEKWNKVEIVLDNKFQKKQKQRNKLYALRTNLYKRWKATGDKVILKKIKRLEKYNLGKDKFNTNRIKTKDTIKNVVNQSVNELVEENPQLKTLVLEKLNRFNKDKKYSSRSIRLMNNWKRGFLEKKIIFISQLNSIELAYQNPAYSSQECPNCGYPDRDNRHNEEFICIKCGYSEHADVVGAKNILKRKYDTEIGLYTPYKQVKTILLKRYSVGDINPPRLEILDFEKSCESYKQSIQEHNSELATVGGCDSTQS
jgi:transposase